MCGINGLLVRGTVAPGRLQDAIRAMNEAIGHRGPDGDGVWIDEPSGTAFGHRRLSIIDLSASAAQPMQTNDDRVVMVFNGEVYNFPALRSELRQHGYTFRSHGDSEVALKAFHCWGPAAFSRMNGMFAIALFDRRDGKVFLVRDRLGIKPLHYLINDKGVYFSSEIKGINASGMAELTSCFDHLHEFLYYGNTLGEATLFKGVKRLLPGHYLEINLRSFAIVDRCYWSAADVAERAANEKEAVASVHALVEQAVKRQLVGDVPLGVFLSGGIDSSSVVAFGSRHYGGRLRTYTVGFDYIGDRDERAKAQSIAARFGTEHHELSISLSDAMQLVQRLIAAHDMPFSDAANLPLYQLCHALGGATKVVLQGDGGDELFGGYNRYQLLSAGPLRHLARLAALINDRIIPRSAATYTRRRILDALSERDASARMARLLTVENPNDSPLRALSPDVRAEIARSDPFCRYRDVAVQLSNRDPVQMMMLADLQIILPDIFLEKVDRATMAQSVEVRVPYLDHELVDYVISVPARLKVNWRHKKLLLAKALRGVVPDPILDGPKIGFGVPFSAWMRGALADRLLDTAAADSGGANLLLDGAQLEALVHEHRHGVRDHGFLLWKCLQLALWREYAASLQSGHAKRTLALADQATLVPGQISLQ
jgi:asparagine synthase (glutamine-hydrolysing)